MLGNKIKFAILLYIFIFVFWSFSFSLGESSDDAEDKRNPFIPLVTADGRLLVKQGQSRENLIVEGILYDKKGHSLAIVNGSVVGAEDMLGHYKILKIEENQVIFSKGGQVFEVEMHKENEE